MPLSQRFDPDQAQQILSRAADLQQKHLETVSAEQLEALAAEVGLSPEFVRQALQEADGIVAPAPPVVRTAVEAPPVQGVTRQDLVIGAIGAIVAPLVAGMLLGALHAHGPWGLQMPILLSALVVAALGATAVGFRIRSRRLGTPAGAVFGLIFLMALLSMQTNSGEVGPALPIGAIGGATLGLMGAGLRRLWDRLPNGR